MVQHYSRCFFAFVLTALALTTPCWAQPSPASSSLPSVIAFDRPTVHRVDAATLPKPFDTKSAFRASKVVPQPADAKLYLPKGFRVNIFAEGNFNQARWMTLAPNGDVFLADSRANSIIILRDKNKDGVAEERFIFSTKLSQPFGMAFHKDWFYVANTDSIVRFKYSSGQTAAGDAETRTLTKSGADRSDCLSYPMVHS